MARTIAQIKQIITDGVENDPNTNQNLTKVANSDLWQLYAFIVASCIWTLEKLFDTHKSDTEETITNKDVHTKQWYSNKAIEFQYGHALIGFTDQYATIDEDAQIIAQSAVSPATDSFLKMKLAKLDGDDLAALSGDWPNNGVSLPLTGSSGGSGEKLAFYTFMERVKDAGVKLRYISQDPDNLRLVIDIHYDTLVLNENGERLDGENSTPVQDAIKEYLKSLEFNAEYTNNGLTNQLEAIDGVVIPDILSAEAKWGLLAFSNIEEIYVAEAGHMIIEDVDLTINWKPYGQ